MLRTAPHTLPHTDKTPGVLTTIVVEVDLPLNPAPRSKPAPLPAVTRIAPPRGSHRSLNGTGVEGIGTGVGGIETSVDPWAARREALRGHLARARSFAQVVRRGKDSNVAEVAEHAGMSAVRLRQLLYLLNLAHEILADIEDPLATGAVPSETVLRKVAGVRPLSDQIKAHQEMTGRAFGPRPMHDE